MGNPTRRDLFGQISNYYNDNNINTNQISGLITNDIVKNLPKLNTIFMRVNFFQGLDARFCHGNQPLSINTNQNVDLKIFENPYHFCTHVLDTFATKPRVILSSTKIPCDHHRCWMKKYASKFTIQIDDCPDGRRWKKVSEIDVCGQGE